MFSNSFIVVLPCINHMILLHPSCGLIRCIYHFIIMIICHEIYNVAFCAVAFQMIEMISERCFFFKEITLWFLLTITHRSIMKTLTLKCCLYTWARLSKSLVLRQCTLRRLSTVSFTLRTLFCQNVLTMI